MLFTVFCRILNILKNHAFWQTIRIWFEDNFTFLGPCWEMLNANAKKEKKKYILKNRKNTYLAHEKL